MEDLDDNFCENNILPLEKSSLEMKAAEALLELNNITLEMENHQDSAFLTNKNEEISDLLSSNEKFSLYGLLKKDDDLKIFTGIDFNLLRNLCEAYKVCEKKSVHYHSLKVCERIVLCLSKLKLNLSFKCLAVLFGVSRNSCSKIFLNTLHFLAYILKHAIYWPTKEEILCSMPICFRKFRQTFGVMDCTEIPLEKAKCLNCRICIYSHYKGCDTMKFLVVVSPSGSIIYISEPYGGRASDKAIFNHTDILKKFEPTRDAIMVDKGFSIEEECALSRIKLIIPPKLSKNKQFSKDKSVF